MSVSPVDASGIDLSAVQAVGAGGGGLLPAGVLAGVLAGIAPERVVDDGDLLEVAAGFQLLVAWAEAGLSASVAEFARRPAVVNPAGTAGPGARGRAGQVLRDFAGDEVGLRLGWTARAGEHRVRVAAALAAGLPLTRAALAAGVIDYPRAAAMVEETTALDPAGAGRVEQVVLGRGRRASTGQWRQGCRRAAVAVDPAAADARCAKARADRRVWAGPAGDGTGIVEALLRVEDAAAIDTVISAAARTWAQTPGQTRTMDQLRADAFAAPFLLALHTGTLAGTEPVALARHHGRPPAVHLHLHPDTLTSAGHQRAGDQPAGEPRAAESRAGEPRGGEIAGFGPIPATLARHLAQHAHTRTDPTADPGAEAGAEPGYRPSRALADHVEHRDRTCRAPGCPRPAQACELDHTIAHPRGPTAAANLGPLCKHHHLFKHSTGVRLEQPTPGHFRWHLPTGHIYDVDPPEY